MIEAKIEKASNGKGHDIHVRAIGDPIELAKEITYLVLGIHDSMARTYEQQVYRRAIQLALAKDSKLWAKEADDE